jgi:copper oxidase (laccase) domain-containing protein
VVETVKRLQSAYGTRPEHLRAAIGPAIGPCCFEVGPEVRQGAQANPWPGLAEAFVAGPTREHMDLFQANQQQLIHAGLKPEHVYSSGLCTFCRADLFYSWRRDKGRTGRMQAAIASTGSQHS